MLNCAVLSAQTPSPAIIPQNSERSLPWAALPPHPVPYIMRQETPEGRDHMAALHVPALAAGWARSICPVNAIGRMCEHKDARPGEDSLLGVLWARWEVL